MGSYIEFTRELIDNPDHPWPNYNCVTISLLLAPYLRLSEPEDEFEVVFGSVYGKGHCWIVHKVWYIDPSLGQFEHMRRRWSKPCGIVNGAAAQRVMGYSIDQRLGLEEENILRNQIKLTENTDGRWRTIGTPSAKDSLAKASMSGRAKVD